VEYHDKQHYVCSENTVTLSGGDPVGVLPPHFLAVWEGPNVHRPHVLEPHAAIHGL